MTLTTMDTTAMPDMPTLLHHDELSLAAVLTAAGCARMLVRDDLRRWTVSDEAVGTAELLVSELVTNAVKTTGITEPHPSYHDLREGVAVIRIRLQVAADRLAVSVWDGSSNPPQPQDAGLDAESGRGLFLVDRLSSRWGYYPSMQGGKVVWFELAATGTSDTAHEEPAVLPRRQPRRRHPRPTRAMSNPDVLHRVLAALLTLSNGTDRNGGSNRD